MLEKNDGRSETSRNLGASGVLRRSAEHKSEPRLVRNVTVAREGSGLRVEVTLSSPVQPSIETAVNPDRILRRFSRHDHCQQYAKRGQHRMACAGCARASTAPFPRLRVSCSIWIKHILTR